MAYSPPQPYRTPNGMTALLPPEVAAGLVGFEPQMPPDPGPGAVGAPPAEPPPPVDRSLLATPPVLPAPQEPTLAGAVADIARPGLAGTPGATAKRELPPWSQPSKTGYAKWEFEGWDPYASEEQQRADFEEYNRRAATTGPNGEVIPGTQEEWLRARAAGKQAGAPPASARAPLTTADIRAGGYAPVLERQLEGAALERAAGQAQAEADRRAAEAEGKAIADSNARDVAREAERARIQQETMADLARRSAAIDSEIDRIANLKIDASVRRPAVGAIGLAMGALGAALAGRTDGANPALDIMTKQIETNVQRQMAERDAQIKAVGMRRDQMAGIRQRLTDTNALYDGLAAAETRRMRGEIAQIAAASKSEMTKANLLKLDATLAEKQAAYEMGAKDKQFAFDDKERAFKEQQAARLDASRRGWAELGQRDRQFKAQEARANRALDIEAAKYQQAAAAAGGKQLEEDRKLAVGGGGFKEVVVDGKTVKVPDVIRNSDGSPFRAATEKEAIELREGKAAVDTVNDFVGQIVRGIKDHGGESEYFKSADWQKQRSRIAFTKNAIRVGEKMGTLDSGSEKLMDQMAGAVDPTSFWRDASAGLIQMRDNLTTGFNSKLRAQPGYTGTGYIPPDTTSLQGPAKTAEDKRVDDAMLAPTKLSASQVERELGGAPGRMLRPQEVADRLRENGGMLPSQKGTLEVLARAAREAKEPEQRTKAAEQLGRLANSAQAPGVRKYAAELLQGVAEDAGTPTSSEPLPEK